MKKIILISISLFSMLSLYSQKPDSPWLLGPKAGVNFTTITGEFLPFEDYTTSWIPTPIFGAAAAYSFNSTIALSFELNMAKWGTKSEFAPQDIEVDENSSLKERYSSIQIPVMAKFTFGNNWQPFVYGGFYWSMIMCGKYVMVEDGREISLKVKYRDETVDISDDELYLNTKYNQRLDVGVNLGLGLQKQLGPGNLVLDARFGMGFLDYRKFPDGDKPDDYKPRKNRSISISLAYLFML